jgi:hypothetical protein
MENATFKVCGVPVTVPADGTYHHVAAWFTPTVYGEITTAGSIRLYVDGEPVAGEQEAS